MAAIPDILYSELIGIDVASTVSLYSAWSMAVAVGLKSDVVSPLLTV